MTRRRTQTCATIDWSGAPKKIARALDRDRDLIAAFAVDGGKTAAQVVELMAVLCDCDAGEIWRHVTWRAEEETAIAGSRSSARPTAATRARYPGTPDRGAGDR
jgi:hypothetical protein